MNNWEDIIQMSLMEKDNEYANFIIETAEIKIMEFIKINKKVRIENILEYFVNVKLPKITDISFMKLFKSIMKIKYNRLIEYMNSQRIVDKSKKLSDFEDLFK
ncbi:hypothetical protein NPX79_03425 [Spiroplasma endosymbiont of Anurida maritima]|uniref:hypothetical protein n=1 Tax=Spiroplasma endosymbiont of Anurida maritima TaxID=2967972 RepID=UPI0036D26635